MKVGIGKSGPSPLVGRDSTAGGKSTVVPSGGSTDS